MRMFLTNSVLTAIVWGMSCFILPSPLWGQSPSDQVDELLRERIEASGMPPRIEIADELIYSSIVLPLFYERRAYRPAWSDGREPLSGIDDLIEAIRQANGEGLWPADYHLDWLETKLEEIHQQQRQQTPLDPRRLADLDLLATDAFLILGSHYLAGRINPETIDPEWLANRREADLAEALQKALTAGHIRAALEDLLPPQPGYVRLKAALQVYRHLVDRGGWPNVPAGQKMKLGDSGPRVAALRSRLAAEGFLDRTDENRLGMFDDDVDQAVRRFQYRHGLEADGIVGLATLGALNITARERVCQIEVNLERWRWLPQELGKRYLLVNIAAFELDVIEDAQPVLVMHVVVGRDARRTPVFSDWMTYLVLNPYWHIPQNIAVVDKLPLIQADVEYLFKEHIRVYGGSGGPSGEIDPQTIDWSQVTPNNFSYLLRQDPGPWNALGRVKFMFPNKFNVYLHDTPSRELFSRSERAFSSGCIRVQKPIELAEYLLRGDPKWTPENIRAALDKGTEQTVRLPEAMLVHLLYTTAWVDQQGQVFFRKDIYGRDRLVAEALSEQPPCAD